MKSKRFIDARELWKRHGEQLSEIFAIPEHKRTTDIHIHIPLEGSVTVTPTYLVAWDDEDDV